VTHASTRGGLTRRRVLAGAAWTTPIIVSSAVVPAYAASYDDTRPDYGIFTQAFVTHQEQAYDNFLGLDSFSGPVANEQANVPAGSSGLYSAGGGKVTPGGSIRNAKRRGPHLLLRVRVVDDIVYLLGFELMEDGHNDGAIGHCGQKGDSPVCTVASADGNLVSRLNPGRFKQNVKLLNFASHILVLEGHALIVGEGIEIPMINDALLNQTDKVFVMVFHEE